MTPAIPHRQTRRELFERAGGKTAEPTRELHVWEVLCVWFGGALAGWMLVGLATTGIWGVLA